MPLEHAELAADIRNIFLFDKACVCCVVRQGIYSQHANSRPPLRMRSERSLCVEGVRRSGKKHQIRVVSLCGLLRSNACMCCACANTCVRVKKTGGRRKHWCVLTACSCRSYMVIEFLRHPGARTTQAQRKYHAPTYIYLVFAVYRALYYTHMYEGVPQRTPTDKWVRVGWREQRRRRPKCMYVCVSDM